MSNGRGPWDIEPPKPAPAPMRRRPWLWLLFVVALGGIVAALARAFPEALRTRDDWASVGYSAGVLILLASGLARFRREAVGRYLRHAAIWVAIVAVLALGLAYREELAGVPQRLRLAFSPGAPVTTGDHELVIPQNDQGGFVVVGKVNGQRVRFVVDTGATDTVLSPDDARRLGIPVDSLAYESEAETANGTGYGAPYAVQSLEIGPIAMGDFKLTINKAPISSSLLGLSFLNRLESFEFRGRKLILKWRDAGG
ncbi:TIGR02281 family clan AA aspartic protease [Phenylobacterium sp.]|uniref:retropepsin-like aspartic protease family protein n=1 Tax=Phenylobacterium sp. TaxID=1871053 RepID=UPI0025E2368E|nr:TIGR02281 family clan AA aspartic protease [Phenylobacterium sp.]